MAGLPDFGDLAKKMKVGELMSNVTSAINPAAQVPPEAMDDPIAYRIVQLRELIDGVSEKEAALKEDLGNVKTHLNGILDELVKAHPPKEAAASDDAKADEAKAEDASDSSEPASTDDAEPSKEGEEAKSE